MADIYGTIQVVIQALTPLVSAEASLLSGLPDDISAIRNELQSISVFLKNAEEKAEGDDAAKEWVRQIRVLAYDIEDAIERYLLFQKENAFGKAKQYLSLEVRGMATTIRSLRERAIDIGRARDSYRFNDRNPEQGNCSYQDTQTTTMHYCMTENFELVGAETSKQEIIKLLGEQELNLRPSAVAVVGMRGLGKTTVVGSIYNDREVKGYFPTRAWITVTQPRRHVDILRSMMQQFYETSREHLYRRPGNINHYHNQMNQVTADTSNINRISSMDKRALLALVRSYLKEKRYLVVFDDVQIRDMELGTYIKRVLPPNDKGSKIVMITRYENVAYAWLDGSLNGLYKLKPLPSEKSWELFCRRTFKSSDAKCPSLLDDLGRGIVKKCGGLPLAILAVGRLLSGKANDMHEWKKVRRSLGFYLETDSQLSGIHKTFMRNYYDLPYYLKPCFLYFGLFPKGYAVERMRLIRLWIAEGFIGESRGNLTLEEVAEEYLNELINMCIIEVKSTDPSGKPRTVGVVNEFLHEIILSKVDELSFCKILSKSNSGCSDNARRLSIHKNHESSAYEVLDSITGTKSNIRGIFSIEAAPDLIPKVLTKAFLKSVRLLKILDLSNAPIDAIPKELGKLFNLHYLSLRNTRVGTLPYSIGKLQSLQTLDLKQTLIHELPKEINHLQRLRHLLIYCYEYNFSSCPHCYKIKGVMVPQGAVGKFRELQKLAFLDVGAGSGNSVIQLRNLKQLRKLGIIGLKREDGKDLCSVIGEMEHLQAFSVFSDGLQDTLDLEHVTTPPLMLKRLYLNGRLASFPSFISTLHSLVKIRLRWSNLTVDPLERLEALPNLVELQLLEAYVGEHLKIGNAGFQKLKILHLLDLKCLKSLFICKGALSLLEELSIGESRKMQVPSGIKYLSKLKTLNFYSMPSSFADRLLPGEQYYSIVKHVPNVFFHEKHPEGHWKTYTR